jgi:transglutaminase-like putative cysteine protease
MGSQARARIALGGLMVVTLFSWGQVIAEGDYPGPALLGMAIAAAIAIIAQRLGWPTLLTVALSAVALTWYVSVVFVAKRTFYSLPTPASLEGIVNQIRRAYDHSLVDYAPVPVRPGYVILIVISMWLLVTIGEIAAFRWKRPLLAGAGPIATFAFILIIGTRLGTPILIALFLGTLLTFWGLEASHRLRSWGRWVPVWEHQSSQEPAAVTGSIARRMGASCIALAIAAPLFLPALNDGLLSWRSGGGPGPGSGSGGTSVDPLVSIVPKLIRQSDATLFRVSAERAAYWRLVSLARFDGEKWGLDSAGRVNVQSGTIQTQDPPQVRVRLVETTFEILDLEGSLLPAAVHPVEIAFEGDQPEVSYDIRTGDLRTEDGLSRDMRYRVSSYVPDLTLDALRGGAIGDPGPEYKEIPGELSEEVLELLANWTADAETPADKLIAIQDRLRGFGYSLDVEDSASKDYLTDFLTETRRGYCQQFATAFAVLARQLGYPARVSVGFLPGETDTAQPGQYLVRGTDAHAWPEVYFEGFGWVPFEPTPRSSASPPRYTLTAAAGPNGDTGSQDPQTADPDEPQGSARITDPRLDPRGGGTPLVTAPPEDNDAWRRSFSILARSALVVALLYLLLVPLFKAARTKRMYSAAATPGDVAVAAFTQVQGDAHEMAASRRPAESARVFLARLAKDGRIVPEDGIDLARLYDAALYAAHSISEDEATRAKQVAERARNKMWASASLNQKAARLFSIGSLRTPRPRARRLPVLRLRRV